MAGGMTPGEGETRLQPVQNARARDAARRGHSTADFHGVPPADWANSVRESPETPPPIKHCSYDGPHGRQEALLLEWRGVSGYFRGRIAVAAEDPGGWAIVEQWVEQGMLSPIA